MADAGGDGGFGRGLRPPVAVALALFVAVRLLVVLAVVPDTGSGDGLGYRAMAENVLRWGTLSTATTVPPVPTAWRAPLFPLFAAAVAWPGWPVVPATVAAQFGLEAATGLGLGAAVRRHVGRREADAFLLIWAVQPFTALAAVRFLAETLTAALLAVGTAPLMGGRARWRPWAAGAALGAAAMARDIYLLLPFAFALALPFAARRDGWRARAGLGLVVGAALAVSPLFVRNCRDTTACTPVSRGLLWLNLWIGSWERDGRWMAAGMTAFPPDAFPDGASRSRLTAALARLDDGGDGAALDREARRLALARYRTAPAATVASWVVRAPRGWIGTRSEIVAFRPSVLRRGGPAWALLKSLLLAADLVILALAGIGLFGGLFGTPFGHACPRAALVAAVPPAYTLLVYLPFHDTETRYTLPVLPFLLVLAAIGMVRLGDLRRSGKGCHPEPASASMPPPDPETRRG